ncbi:ricin-type beta-trefoil lectin domain protein [Streptomyces sp. NPDC051597]|uniref:ricin-type beta-trefoil lectin domain protein n=1 Tax=Streptomyces sp. NPDC051597 TaxID=3155049 RepID=UPI00343A3714
MRRGRRLPAALMAAALGAGGLAQLAAAHAAFADEITGSGTQSRTSAHGINDSAAEINTSGITGSGSSTSGAGNSGNRASAAEAEARAQAKRTGRQVEILDRRDEMSQVLANPDGSLTMRQYVRPAFARVGGAWRAADATLKQGADGRYAPAAATFGISFSGGGTGPLATMTKDGRALSVSWPDALPQPRVEGDTALYPEVLPGVDLTLRADVDGFAQHLVVKDREAAANPRLTELSLALRLAGARLKADARGNLTATDTRSGARLFTAPAPTMWDSSHLPKQAAAQLARGARPAAETGPPALVPMGTEVDGDHLRITPDAAMLKDPKTVFPVVIDPVFSGGGRNNWAMAYKQSGNSTIANTAYWNGGTFSDKIARLGHETSTNGTARSYFQLNTKGLAGSKIISATFNVFNSYSWSCTKTPVELGLTGPISTATTWNNQPAWKQTLQEKTFAHGWSSTQCAAAGEDFDAAAIKTAVQAVADSGATDMTLGLRSRADFEGNEQSWKKFQNDPSLEITYNSPPKVDSSGAFQGSWAPGADGLLPIACSTDPAAFPVVGNDGLTLTAKVSDPEGGQITGAFQLKDYDTGAVIASPTSTVTAGGTAQARIDASLLATGKRYTWTVQSRDGLDTSAWTTACGLGVDKAAPSQPTVAATDGHALDVAEVPARTDRTLRFASTDQGGVDGFCYSLNQPLSVSGLRCPSGTYVKAAADGTATVTVKPSLWPNNRLHVQAYDKAGNSSAYGGGSAPTDTTLIATDRPAFVHDAAGRVHGDLPGDLDGDGQVDLLATASDGTLRLLSGQGDGTLKAPRTLASGGWNGVRVAHRGDFIAATDGQTMDGYEDFFVKVGNKLYLYPGDGNGMPLTTQRKELLRPTGKDNGPLTGPGGLCLDVKSASSANGTPLQIYTCNATAAQDFQLTGGALKVLGKCAAVAGTDLASAVQLADCDGSPAQQWLDRGDGSLLNQGSGRCLDTAAGAVVKSTPVQILNCRTTATQDWVVPGTWAGTGQILTPRDADGMPGSDLIVQEGEGMWLYSGTAEGPLAAEPGSYKLLPAKQFGFTSWDRFDFTSPGDVNGDGIPDLLGRHVTTDPAHADYGKLYLYPGTRATDTSGNSTYGVGARTVYGPNSWQSTNIPFFAGAGNAQGTVVDTGTYLKFEPTAGQETPDFWAVFKAAPGGLRFYPGTPTTHGTSTVVGDAALVQNVVGLF